MYIYYVCVCVLCQCTMGLQGKHEVRLMIRMNTQLGKAVIAKEAHSPGRNWNTTEFGWFWLHDLLGLPQLAVRSIQNWFRTGPKPLQIASFDELGLSYLVCRQIYLESDILRVQVFDHPSSFPLKTSRRIYCVGFVPWPKKKPLTEYQESPNTFGNPGYIKIFMNIK